VRTASNGCEGLAALDAGLPDLIVLDIEMAVLDGPGMATQILIIDMGRETIPIVLVSGFVELPSIAERIGTSYFLAKPFRLDAFLDLVAQALIERRPPTPVRGGSDAAQ
jgi:CheY-like chemotaxis protein